MLTYTGLENKQQDDPDRPVIAGQVPNPKRIPVHTPEWTDNRPSDPGRTGDVTLKRGILAAPASQSTSTAQPGNLSGTDGTQEYKCPEGAKECTCAGVLDCHKLFSSKDCKKNSEWMDSNDHSKGGCIQATSVRKPMQELKKLSQPAPGTTTDQDHKDWIIIESMSSPIYRSQSASPNRTNLKAADTSPRYECGQEGGECHCSGVLDCKKLWDSGECKSNTEWEDGNDPSKGGCIEK